MAIVTGDPNLENMTPDGAESDKPKAIEGRSLRQIALARLKRDKWTLLAMTVAGIYLLLAVLAPFLVKLGIIDPTGNHPKQLDGSGNPIGSLGGMSASHWLGLVPQSGTDVLSRLVYGITFSVLVGVSATVIAISIGLVVGLVAGFSGGKLDFLCSRVIDLILCFPQTLMLLAMSGTMIQRLTDMGLESQAVAPGVYVSLVLGLFGWPTFARIVRGQVMTLRNREFIEAARSLGATTPRIYRQELLPNLWAPLLVYATIMFPVNVSAEAALSFLGVGIKPPTPTIGNIILDSVQFSQQDVVYFLAPIIVLTTMVLSFNLVGDGLRDALDPKADRH